MFRRKRLFSYANVSMKTKLKLRKFTCIVLALSFIIHVLPIYSLNTVMAKSSDKSNNEINHVVEDLDSNDLKNVPISYEVVDKRESNVKYFKKVDGTTVASYYNEPVHYFENGKWEQIDNRLVIDKNDD